MVDRRNFERVYDITERAIPSEYLDQKADEEDVWRYFLKRAIDCLAIATIKDILGYLNFHIYCLDKKQSEKNTLEEKVRILKQEDVVVEIEVEEDPKPHYALSGSLPLLAKIQGNKELGNRAWFLSPFDNVVWDRNRVRRLFDADMRLEAYFPASKRQFGYYAMPILWNDRIVGRLDPRVDRKSETMVLENLELNINCDEERIAVAAICQELTDFMAFNGCSRVKIRKAKPAEAKNLLF